MLRITNGYLKALKKFLDEAKHGVIYFALGSIVPDHLLPQKYFDNFINVFRRLQQRVLWKTSSELKGLPENVMTLKWVPQQDVLAHTNVVLFMTHGGLFSQHEAINAGVPVVCTPYFGDQPMNAKFYEEKGIGVQLLYNTLSEETIYSAVTTVLNNPNYKENMQRLSRIYRDQPVSPADSLVFWVEYVLRHKGAQHLRPASALLPWYQLALLDVLAVILLAVSVSLFLLYIVIKKTISFIRGNEKSTPNSASSTSRKKNN